jgi:predicted PurR-regulated permease PerM
MYCMTGRWDAASSGVAGAAPAAGPEDGSAPAAAAPGTVQTSPGLGGFARRFLSRMAPGSSRTAAEPELAASPEPTAVSALVEPEAQVPRLLRQLAAWSWRLLLVGLAIYVIFRLAVHLRLVVLPFIAALLLTALLQPLTARLRRAGMAPMLATWCAFLLAIVVIAGAVTLFADRVSADYPTLAAEVTKTARQIQHSLAGPPFHLNAARLQNLTNDVVKYLSQHKTQIAGTVLAGGRIAIEFLTGIVLMLFITFFLIKDGNRIWWWLIKGMPPEARRRVAAAGDAAWRSLVNYVRGTIVVAAIHALVLGLTLWILGVPLLVPLIVLIFLASFLPVIGILAVGSLAILITLATKGWVAAVVLLAVLIVENQLEGHLLQPLVVGRIVRLHPLAIIVVLAVGAIIAGIPGAIVAVPLAAVITYAWPALRSGPPQG